MSAEQAPLQPPPQYAPRLMGPLIIPERKEFVPEWCPWRMVTEAAWRGDREAWDKLATTKVWSGSPEAPRYVVSNGVEVTVAHVLPERRFAIQQDGQLKDVNTFARECELKWIETFAIAGQKQTGDSSVIAKTIPEAFVKWTEDPRDRRRRVRIGFDPLAAPPVDAKPRTLEDATEDPVASAAPGLVHTPEGVFPRKQETHRERLDMLHELRNSGALSQEEYATGMRKIAEEAGWADSGSRGVLESATPIDASPSSHPTSSASPDQVQAPSALFSSKTQCGRTYEKVSQKRAEQAVRMHARRCRECIQIRDTD
jgi:hypothetical protein